MPWASAAATVYEKALSINVMSKAFRMAGLRIGWVACQDKAMLKKIEYVKHYTSICNSAPSEILTIIALHNKDQILARNNQIVEENLELLDKFFKEYAYLFEWVRPEGGCIGFVRYKGSELIDSFCDRLVKNKNVLLLPASVYNYNGNYFRIGFGRKSMPESLDQLKGFLSMNE
jgi:aspartate/methionine/tyrosine aminotransferase